MLANLNDIRPALDARRVCLAGFDIAGGQTDFLLGVLRACEAARCPALLLLWAPSTSYMGLEACADLVGFFAKRSAVPVVLHLDHGRSEELVEQVLDLGFRSVMFDGSALPLEENIRRTREMARLAHGRGASIEGELGQIGSEQGQGVPGELTDPDQAVEFIRQTEVDFFAPSVGNAHGFYKSTPRLRFDLIGRIYERTGRPLSLHGGTGIPMEDVRQAARLGARKMNVATLIHKQFSDRIKQAAAAEQFYWRKATDAGREAITAAVLEYIRELNLEGLA